MNAKEIARTLATITAEQWEAILSTTNHVNAMQIAKGTSKFDSECGKKVEVDMTEDELKFKVISLLKKMGVPPHVLGYTYLQDAIILVYEDESYIHNLVKKLYPAVAKMHGTTGTRVERAIRHAMESTYKEGDLKLLEEIFNTQNKKPINSYAIATLVEYIKMHD